MKLYVCYGLFRSPRPGGHPCRNAHRALLQAGHRPQVVRSYGLGMLPEALNLTRGRREVKRLTGSVWVPLLVNDDGSWIQGSHEIAAWARSHPRPG
jgi:hypothetical protein